MRHRDKLKKGQARVKDAHHHGQLFASFSNPWPSARSNWSQTLEARLPFELVTDHHHEARPVKVIEPDFDRQFADTTQIQAVWLGHAGFLVQLPAAAGASRPIRMLFDPMLSHRASPVRFVGPARRLRAPCKVEDLPEVDFVFISHSHYDHLDHHTIVHAYRSCAEHAFFCVPLGLGGWLEDSHIPSAQIIELDWWDTRSMTLDSLLSTPEAGSAHLQLACVPAQHGSGRSVNDQGATLWCGWTLEQAFDGKRAAVYHAGDTGFRAHPQGEVCPAFEDIGKRLGPFDLSFIPIWRGASLSFLSYLGVRVRLFSASIAGALKQTQLSPEAFTQAHHCTPADAISLHQAVQSRHTLAMHFATFAGSDDEAQWPVDLLLRARTAAGVPDFAEEGGIGYIDVGDVASVGVSSKAEEKSA